MSNTASNTAIAVPTASFSPHQVIRLRAAIEDIGFSKWSEGALLAVLELQTQDEDTIQKHLEAKLGPPVGLNGRRYNAKEILSHLREGGFLNENGIDVERVLAASDCGPFCDLWYGSSDCDPDYGWEFRPETPAWRKKLRTPSELQKGQIEFFIKDFLPEGITFLGGLSGSGKSWLALSIAKALTTGKNFLGCFEVPEIQNVIYLAPESGEKSLRTRLEILGIPEERFFCTTVNNGIVGLGDIDLLTAIADLKPILFLDTAVRFLNGQEENSASDISSGLTESIFALRRAGCRAVVAIHHSPKSSAKEALRLENTLRGSGDLGAMSDCVYAIRCMDQETFKVQVACVKPRDFEPPQPFYIQGRPYLNEKGDFGLLTEPGQTQEQIKIQKLVEAIQQKPQASYRELQGLTGFYRNRIPEIAAKEGWIKAGNQWQRRMV